MKWLFGKLIPNYHTIADFRKDNPAALKNMFKLFVAFMLDAGLISGKTIAIDGTKSRVHNSKKNNYTQNKLARHFKFIEEKTRDYLNQMDALDREEDAGEMADVNRKLEMLKQNKIK